MKTMTIAFGLAAAAMGGISFALLTNYGPNIFGPSEQELLYQYDDIKAGKGESGFARWCSKNEDAIAVAYEDGGPDLDNPFAPVMTSCGRLTKTDIHMIAWKAEREAERRKAEAEREAKDQAMRERHTYDGFFDENGYWIERAPNSHEAEIRKVAERRACRNEYALTSPYRGTCDRYQNQVVERDRHIRKAEAARQQAEEAN